MTSPRTAALLSALYHLAGDLADTTDVPADARAAAENLVDVLAAERGTDA